MVGIMLTGTNLTQEREAKTLDALLCTPITFKRIILSKSLSILLLSIIAQTMVYIINYGFSSELLILLIPMFMGGLIFILIGSIIGLTSKTPQTGTAVSTVVMISMFLIVAVYTVFPVWAQKIATLIPSISISVIIKNLMSNKEVYSINCIVALFWIVTCTLIVHKLINKWNI